MTVLSSATNTNNEIQMSFEKLKDLFSITQLYLPNSDTAACWRYPFHHHLCFVALSIPLKP